MHIHDILSEAIRQGASDIVIKVGVPPGFRVGTALLPVEDMEPLDAEMLEAFAGELLDAGRLERLEAERQIDFAYENEELGRFRANIFHQRGVLSMVIRLIPSYIRNCDELNLPPVVEKLAAERRGLILVTGTTGSGKTTTLAAMIEHINQNRQAHIITIEDPIEYVHEDHLCFINQREVGYDALDFPVALRAALRQNPDVILVGEMRDLETIETAIMAAETGHLVMSTLHTLDAPESITRIISAFPEHQREQARLILASVLRGIISLRLLPRADGQGLVPASEILVASARVKEYVADKEKTRDLPDVISQGHTTYQMQTFDQSLMALYKGGLITYDEALINCSNPNDFDLKVRGIASTSDLRWDEFDQNEERTEPGDKDKLDIERF